MAEEKKRIDVIWKLFLYAFAFMGIFSIILFFIDYSKHNNASKRFIRNCAEIKEGMSLKQAKLIMGDDNANKYRSEIWLISGNGSAPEFYLAYPTGPGGSYGPQIYFDPKTLIVNKVICGK